MGDGQIFMIFSATLSLRKTYRMMPLSTPISLNWTIPLNLVGLSLFFPVIFYVDIPFLLKTKEFLFCVSFSVWYSKYISYFYYYCYFYYYFYQILISVWRILLNRFCMGKMILWACCWRNLKQLGPSTFNPS